MLGDVPRCWSNDAEVCRALGGVGVTFKLAVAGAVLSRLPGACACMCEGVSGQGRCEVWWGWDGWEGVG